MRSFKAGEVLLDAPSHSGGPNDVAGDSDLDRDSCGKKSLLFSSGVNQETDQNRKYDGSYCIVDY